MSTGVTGSGYTVRRAVYQASLLRMRDNEQPVACKLHSAKYHVTVLLIVPLLKKVFVLTL